MPPELDVVQDGHALEEFDILECSRNANFGDGVGGDAEDVFTFVKNPAFLGCVKSTDAVQQAGFTGPVGSDNRKNFAVQKLSADIIQCLDPAEGQCKIFNFYDDIIAQTDPLSAFFLF